MSTQVAVLDSEIETSKTKGSTTNTVHGEPGWIRSASLYSFSPLKCVEHVLVSPSIVSHVSDSFGSLTNPS